MSPDLLERTFAHHLQQIACTTREDANRFVSLALRCVQGTPTDSGATPEALIAGRPVLELTIASVAGWLAGKPFSPRHDAVMAAAGKEGPFQARMTGTRAACWSIYNLHEAVEVAIRAGDDPTELNDVAMNAGLVASLTRNASDGGVTLHAIRYQEKLMKEVLNAS